MSNFAQVSVDVTLGHPARPVASVARELVAAANNPAAAMNALWRLFNALAAALITGVVRLRVDSVSDYPARLAIAVTQANLAAGEKIHIFVPGRGTFTLTAVAAVADAEGGEFISQTSNTVTAAAIATAINAMRGLKECVTASADTGTLTIVSKLGGSFGNTIRVIDGTVNALSPAGGLLAGGLSAHSQVTSTVGCVAASTDADDTLRIGKTTFTAKAGTAAGDSQFNIGASNTAMGDNLAAKINAHPDLLGLVTAVAVTGTVTLTWHLPARVALHVGYMVSSDADGLVVTQPSTNLTIANQQASTTYVCGA